LYGRRLRARDLNVKADHNMQDTPKWLIIGISDGSGVTYGVRMLQLLRNAIW
jgi:hypothetical protein